MTQTKQMFVIMPYTPELHYFYLYIQKYIETKHNIKCERADEHIRTQPILDKINDDIEKADVILADCSGRNPNVFYELGISHAKGKKVILITHDAISEAPSDIRHFEFIKYKLDDHVEFLQKLDDVLNNVFEQYEKLYIEAQKIFYEFKNTTKLGVILSTKTEFILAIKNAESTMKELPSSDAGYDFLTLILPRIISNNNQFDVMTAITNYIAKESEKYLKPSTKQDDTSFGLPTDR